MCGAIVCICGGILMKHEFSAGKRGSFMSDIEEKTEEKKGEEKKNMKLPI